VNYLNCQQPILQENYAFLRQKICLMALIESVFKRAADNRTMTFQTIAEETRLPLDEVEHLVMKALRFARFSVHTYFIFNRCPV
jgi:26S proteasome regulatory subunit N9